jgi:hypothetical protein
MLLIAEQKDEVLVAGWKGVGPQDPGGTGDVTNEDAEIQSFNPE